MVVRIITEAVELQDQPQRERFIWRVIGLVRRKAWIVVVGVILGAGLGYAIAEVYPRVSWFQPRARVRVEPPLYQIEARMDEALKRIDKAVEARLQTINSQVGGLPSTDRPAAKTTDTRPWVIHSEGLGAIDSRSPEVSRATEIYVGTDLSTAQVNALAAKVDEQVGPKLDEIVAKVDSCLDERLGEIASQYQLTGEQLALLRTELTRSVGVILKEEMARNQQLWQDNATYRVLYHRSLDLNQDLFALYAGKVKDDHALGNIAKVVPKLFTLQVWQNKDKEDQYTLLLSRYQELLSDNQYIGPDGQE